MTLAEIFRIAAIVATFATAMFLVRTKERRQILAVVLSVAAMFEAGYAVRQAALGQYDIWGWKNKLIFNRATGTFVNPNHFAHYAAIIMPLAVFLCAVAWHTAAPPSAPRGHRIAMLLERRFVPFAFGLLATLACVAAILVSQSRGAMLASVAGFAVVGGLASGRRHAAARATLIALGVLTIFAAMFFVMGTAGESKHLEETDSTTFIGRRTAIESAFRIWLDFPLFGSGAGTFERLAPRFQKPGEMTLANHAHDDYAETLATTGAVGFLLAFVPLLAGAVALARGAFGAQAIRHATWRQRAYCAAALTSIVIALLHALVDFNFFISANPATLAAIAGAAAGVRRPEAT